MFMFNVKVSLNANIFMRDIFVIFGKFLYIIAKYIYRMNYFLDIKKKTKTD